MTILGVLKGDEEEKLEEEEVMKLVEEGSWLMMTWWIPEYDGRSA